ncbi:MAG: PstS family phosphate ABC transporter substrate-binding protein [Planctomycetota bacterium]
MSLCAVSLLAVEVDARLPAYRAQPALVGMLRSVGSSTMGTLMQQWQTAFAVHHPEVGLELEQSGSGTAVLSLIAGNCNLGPMSRGIKESEKEIFREAFGYEPQVLVSAVDMLAVLVHPDNPVAQSGLTLAQVDALFSSSLKRGHPQVITSWDQVGIADPAWAGRAVALYGRDRSSGTYGYFAKAALKKGAYSEAMANLASGGDVVAAVAGDVAGIGYAGLGDLIDGVVPVPLFAGDGSAAPITPSATAQAYPLARSLHVAVDYASGDRIDPLREAFLRFIYSQEGQQIVIDSGFVPLGIDAATEALAQVGLTIGE